MIGDGLPAFAADYGDLGPVDAEGVRIMIQAAPEQHHVADAVHADHGYSAWLNHNLLA